MKVIKLINDNAVVKCDKQKAPNKTNLYGVIINYDNKKEYTDIDCDFYEATLKEAVNKADRW